MYETVDLNIIPVGEIPVVHCSQYDTNRLIRFVLTDGEDPFTFGVLVSVTTTIRKVDGTLWKYEDTAPVLVSSRYEIATDEQMTACAGNNYGELTIKYRDSDVSEDEIKISTLNFILKVELSPETGGLVSQSEINNLDSQIALVVNQQLDNYYTKDEIDDQIEEIVTEQVTPIVSSIVSEQVPPIVQSELGNYYTKTETDTYFYNKSETDTLLDSKANTSDLPDMDDYYTKSDTDTLLSGKVSNSTLLNYYTKSEVDALVGTFDIISTASGAIATFSDGGDNIPVKSLVTDITATQAGTGTPSPSNVRPITGVDSGVVSVCGKNLFDGILEKGYISTTTGEETPNTSGNQWRCKNYIRVKPNTSLYMKLLDGYTTGNSTITVYYYDANKDFIGYESNKGNMVIQMPSNCYWFKFCNFVAVAIQDAPTGNSLNYPSTDTSYHAYNGNKYEFAFGQTVYGGHFDNKGNLVVTHRLLEFDYTSAWAFENSSAGKNFYVACDADIKISQTSENMICNISPVNDVATVKKDHCIISAGRNFNFTWGDTLNLASANDFKTYLQTNNIVIKVIAELVSPITLSITSQDIPTFLGENNIYSNTGDVTVEYFNDKANQLVALYNVLGGI